MSDDEHHRRRPTSSAWRRPPVEERADQVRTWSELAVADLRHPALRALAEAWSRAAEREGVSPPSRETFSPTTVVEALSRTTLLERVEATADAARTWRYRLVGTEIVSLIQADVTGETLERYHPPLAEMLRTQFDATAESGAPKAFSIRTTVDHRSYSYEKIVLPLRSARAAGIDQVMVSSFPTDGA